MPRLSQKWLFLALALYALPRPTEDRGSTIEARSGHPRTPRDGHGPVGSGGGAYSACGVHGFEYAAAGGSEGANRVSATEKKLLYLRAVLAYCYVMLCGRGYGANRLDP